MDLNDLHWAVVVGREGSLTAACAKLGVAPGTLSKAIARLERNTRVKLFERLARGMRTTELGAAFLRRAGKIDLAADDLFAELRDLRQGKAGVLRLGVGQGVPDRWVQPVVKALVERGMAVELSGGMTDSLRQGVVRGELEMAFLGLTGEPADGVDWRALVDDPMQLVAPKGHALARPRRHVSWNALAQVRWLLTGRHTATFLEFESNFARNGVAAPVPTVISYSSGREFQLVLTLDAVALVPRSAMREPECHARLALVSPLGGWRSARKVGVLSRAGAYTSPAAALAKELFEKSVRGIGRG